MPDWFVCLSVVIVTVDWEVWNTLYTSKLYDRRRIPLQSDICEYTRFHVIRQGSKPVKPQKVLKAPLKGEIYAHFLLKP